MKRNLFLTILGVIMFLATLTGGLALDTDNLVMWHTMDVADHSGGVSQDDEGNFDMTQRGDNTTGVVLDGRNFASGDSEYMNTSDNDYFLNGTFSVSFWLNPDTVSTATIFGKYESGTEQYKLGIRNAGTPDFRFTNFKDGCASGVESADWTNIISAGSWVHWVFIKEGARLELFKNNVSQGNRTIDGSFPCTTTQQFQVMASNGGYLDGQLDEFAFFDDVLTQAEISELYNNSAGMGYPTSPPAGGNDSYHKVQIKNLYNNSNIEGVNITWSDGFSNLTDATGTASYSNSSGTLNWTANLTGYFFLSNTTGQAENTTVTGQLYQSVVNFSCFEIITDNSLTCNNGTIYPNAGLYNWTFGTVESPYNISMINVNISALDNRTINVTGFYYNIVNITALNILDNSTISTFNITANSSAYSYEESKTTSDGSILYYLINGSYTFNITYADGYAYLSVNETNNVTTSGNNSYNSTFYLYQENSVYIYIYDSSDGSVVNDNITATFISNSTVFTENIVNGSSFIQSINPETYNIIFESDNYSTNNYYVTVGNHTTQTLNVYLIANPSEVTLTYYDEDTGQVLEGVTVTISRIVAGSWVVTSVLETDISGGILLQYQKYVPYRFVSTRANYTAKDFTLNPIVFSSYNVYMDQSLSQSDETDYSGINIYFTPKTYYNNQNNDIEFTFSAPDGNFNSYGFNVTYGATTVEANGSNAYGEILTNNISIASAPWLSTVTVGYYYELADGTFKDFQLVYLIEGADGVGNNTFAGNKGQDYGIGDLEAGLIVTGSAILVGGAGSLFGGPVIGGILGAFVLGFYAYIEFISWWAVLISLVVLFVIVIWRSSY